ncbi:MAG: hypothetical protein F4142_10105 [Nitrospira sp. SB0675_bin_23]|nr:hypothetical protein [Nitrospira sp. SB0675_bin_23]
MARRWDQSRFDASNEDPTSPLANLLDLMLVFACGLIASLIAVSGELQQHFYGRPQGLQVERGKELPQLPSLAQEGSPGYEPVGQVFRDPKTGKLVLISQ